MEVIAENEQIPKPVDDKRLYRMIRLANGVEALLIHDPEMASQAEEGDAMMEAGEPDEGDEEGDEEVGGPEEGEEEGDEEEDEEGGEESKKAACSVAVGVGSFSDGPIGGLAHFLEHSELPPPPQRPACPPLLLLDSFKTNLSDTHKCQ